MKKIEFAQDGTIYRPHDIADVLRRAVNDKNIIGNSKGEKLYNIPVAFDIETTSFYRDEHGKCLTYEQAQRTGRKLEKCSIMYVWQFGINGRIIVGRTWQEFTGMLHSVCSLLGLNSKRRLVVYVHNLSFEFQFIRNLFNWERVFSIDLRKPIYAITTDGIEFRCSYLLSGYSLAKLGDQLQTYKCAKLVGGLNYALLRHSETPLTETEMQYCTGDIKVVMCYIQERIDESGNITKIPLTKTGFVRKYCRKNCLRTRNEQGKQVQNWGYTNLIHDLNITGLTEFKMLQRAFSGGFTHANANYVGDIIADVASYDFTSSYPYVMVSEQFPMSSGVFVACKSMKQFEYLTSKFCCVFDIEFTDIFAKETQDNPISASKCFIKENYAENNGRIVAAQRLALTITDIDYKVLQMFYSWREMRIGNMYCYKRGYLPKEFVASILHLYEMKTKLKGVTGMETEYLNSKEMLNSCYGMCVTNPLRDEITYNGVWDVENLSAQEQMETLQKYNDSRNRFLFYPWGIFVTSYARRNLFSAIYECKDDYIYSDTDSVKIKNAAKHAAYFAAYNNRAENKLREACKHHSIEFAKCMPVTIRGVTKILGVWDYEGTYKAFKTLGAKRYMVQQENALTGVDGKTYDYSLTVSGVNKKNAIPYLFGKYGADILQAFSNYLEIPSNATGKNIHTYIDYEITGYIVDYLGNACKFAEKTGVHLEPTGYNLSLSVMFLNYLRGIKFHD